jgi:hypothetical protein
MDSATSTEQTSSVRSEIFVADDPIKTSSPIGAEYAASTRLWNYLETKLQRCRAYGAEINYMIPCFTFTLNIPA